MHAVCRYVPVDDLFQIYINYYNGNYTKMPQAIIQECAQTLFLGRYTNMPPVWYLHQSVELKNEYKYLIHIYS